MSEWTAAEISEYDQHLAGADNEVDLLVRFLQDGIGMSGERQAMVNIYLLLSGFEPTRLSGLLMAALRRLATGEEET